MNMSLNTQIKQQLPNSKTAIKYKQISLYTVKVIPLIPLIYVYILLITSWKKQ